MASSSTSNILVDLVIVFEPLVANLSDSITSFWTKQSETNGDNSLLLQEQYYGDDNYVRNPDPNAELYQYGIAEINMESSSPGWQP